MARKSSKPPVSDSPDAAETTEPTPAKPKRKAAAPKAAKPKAAAKAKPTKAGAGAGAGADEADADTKAAPKKARATASSVGVRGAKHLVIVESPKKAKSINKFLGSKLRGQGQHGARPRPAGQGEGSRNRRAPQGYKPKYVIVPDDKKSTIADLKKEADEGGHGLPGDRPRPRRRGDRLAPPVSALGLPDERVRRVKFFEITEKAVKEAFNHVGPIDMDKVNAQQVRRFLDRFVGWRALARCCRRRYARNLSGGARSIRGGAVDRRAGKAEIRAFVTRRNTGDITATLGLQGSSAEATDRFTAELNDLAREPSSRRKTRPQAAAVHDASAVESEYVVSKLEDGGEARQGRCPVQDVSTLQQQAAIRMRFSGKRTMKIAQELYEGIEVGGDGPTGLITYMRTDSLRVSDDSITERSRDDRLEVRRSKYLPSQAQPLRRWQAGSGSPRSHPADRSFGSTPESIKPASFPSTSSSSTQLIFRRFVASQMTPAVFAVTNVAINAGDGVFRVQGKILKFDGYRRVLTPGGKQEDALLPPLAVGQTLDAIEVTPSQHFTQPPPRFSEATLVKSLEKENIGRPSTYAPIIQTIQDRLYVEQKDRRFFATDLGMIVTDLLVAHFPKIMDFKFTAHMEDELDEVASAKVDMIKVLDEFYHPFRESLKIAETAMEKVQVLSDVKCPECGAPMAVKFTKTGSFLGCSRYPECKSTMAMDGSPRASAVETEHKCPKCGKPLVMRESKRGPFLACSGYPKCKESFNLDPVTNMPVPTVVETEHKCDKCGKPMALRQGARGAFLGCTGYPKCKNTMPVDDTGKPVAVVKVEVKCEKCSGPMGVKQGRRGAFLGCLNYPKCRSTAPIPDDLKEQLGELANAPAAAAAGSDLKAIEPEEICENCGGPMRVKQGRRGYFLGCAKYPKCKGTSEIGPVTQEKIDAAVAGAAEAAPAS